MRFLRRSFLVFSFFLAAYGANACQDQTPSVVQEPTKAKIEPGWLNVFSWRSIGPALMSGRIADIAIDPQRPNTWYVAIGSGGVFKTENAGTTWQPIFDHYGSYSIGCVALDPQHSTTVWVGTGENVGGRHIGFGDGVYVSTNGGKSFENRGLKDSGHISKIIVDPRDSQVVFVASQGHLWSGGGERGLFKTSDGGKTWRPVLTGGEYTGVTDLVMDPTNPDVLFAAKHQRQRTVWALLNTGPESGILKSTDGGETWRELKTGLPSEHLGKIGLGISAQDARIIYATIETPNRQGGFYRSTDGGESWTKMSDFVSGGTGPHYYQEIYIDPHRFDVIYHANPVLMRSVDGGKSWASAEGGTKHIDNHAIVFHPTDPDFVLAGTDGGVYRSFDFAKTWEFFANLPITQFYKIDVDYDQPFYNVIGGTQDNATQHGPSRTTNIHGIRNSDWIVPIGGDGHDNAMDPEDPNIFYCESQQGYLRRVDRRTGHSIDIRPRPGQGETDFRFNWDSPILISPHHNHRLYFASNFLHRSDDRGNSWKTISPDLSRGINRWTLPIMGRVWGIDAGFDVMAMSQYSNITSVSESPLVEGLLYVGTDDGLVHVSEDGGENWRKVENITGIPEFAFCNDIKADRHDADTVYACFDHHKTGDYRPYVVRSRDRGRTWELISSDLPERHLVWRIEQDHVEANLLFLGTEFGVFVSLNGGDNWLKMSNGMPTIPVRDLAIQKRENDLVAGTFGRGIYVLDDYSPLRELAKNGFAEREFHVFDLRTTPWYRPSSEYAFGERGFQGDSFFNASNPTFGAAFTIFVRDAFKSKRQQRQELESQATREKRDAEIPSWDALREEEDETAPKIFINIEDRVGKFVNRIECPTSRGIHRLHWDLTIQFPGSDGIRPMVAPGKYRAIAYRMHDGELTQLAGAVEFELTSIMEPSIEPVATQEARLAFQRELAELQKTQQRINARLNKLKGQLGEARRLVLKSQPKPNELLHKLRSVDLKVAELERRLNGDPLKSSRSVEDVPSISSRLGSLVWDVGGNLFDPTQTQRDQAQIGASDLAAAESALMELETNFWLPFRDALKELGIEVAD